MFRFRTIMGGENLPRNQPYSCKAFQFLQKVLEVEQMGLPHFWSTLQVFNPQTQDAVANEIIRSNVMNMGQAYTLVFYFSIWDSEFDQSQTPYVLDRWATEREKLEFRGLKHVRHSIAHQIDGIRARQNAAHFNRWMETCQNPPDIRYDEEKIDITNSNIGHRCGGFFRSFAPHLLDRIANDRQS